MESHSTRLVDHFLTRLVHQRVRSSEKAWLPWSGNGLLELVNAWTKVQSSSTNMLYPLYISREITKRWSRRLLDSQSPWQPSGTSNRLSSIGSRFESTSASKRPSPLSEAFKTKTWHSDCYKSRKVDAWDLSINLKVREQFSFIKLILIIYAERRHEIDRENRRLLSSIADILKNRAAQPGDPRI